MTLPILAACAVAAFVLCLLGAFFIKPLKEFLFMLLRTALGWAALYIFNMIFAFSGFSIGVNIASASIVGILGVPGLVLLSLAKFLF